VRRNYGPTCLIGYTDGRLMSPSQWNPPAPDRGGGRRGLQTARCALCGIELPEGLMVPDGGQACDDVRWYCKDAKSCTQRWTSRGRGPRALPPAPPPASSPAAPPPHAMRAAPPNPDQSPHAEVPAAQWGGLPDS